MATPTVRIQQIIIDSNAIANANGDFSLSIDSKIRDIRIENYSDSGYNMLVGWNGPAGKDIFIPGQSKTYGKDGMLLTGNVININFATTGSGNKGGLLTIWTEMYEVC